MHQVRPNSQGSLTSLLRDLQKLFPGQDEADRAGLVQLRDFLLQFDRPKKVLRGIENLLNLGDPLVAPARTFLRRHVDPQFENWAHPVTFQTLIETEKGRLLSLPPGSRRYRGYCRVIGDIIDRQVRVRFPRLPAELANRPNLFFPGVYFPRELEISNMEMISAMHGTFYVVHAELVVGRAQSAAVVLKPTDMALEAIVTFILQFINRRLDPGVRRKTGPILAPTIVAIDDTYGILDLIAGRNGVEFLPRGIKTGTIFDLQSNEYPPDLDLSREDVLQIAREFAKQAVTAYYLRLYDRKPDQLMIHRTANGALAFSHIDFGRALKRNYALPWKRHYDPSRPALTFDVHEIPYFEAAAAFIYLPHFIPAALRAELNPFEGVLRETIVETFVLLAHEIKSNMAEIQSLFKYLIGRRTQYRPTEVDEVCVEPADVEEVNRSLLALDDPREIIESILNLAYHERQGTTRLRIEGEEDEAGVGDAGTWGAGGAGPAGVGDAGTWGAGGAGPAGIYRRGLLSGGRVTSLRDNPDGPFPYHLVDYRNLGRVFYDAEQKSLKIEFGENPDRVIDHIDRHFSRRLAGYIRQFPGDPRGVELVILSDGSVTVRKFSSEGRVAFKRRLNFPQEIMREIGESGSGFSPEPHVVAHVSEFKKGRPADASDYLQDETAKQRAILSNDLEGKEILQFVMSAEPEGGPLREAMGEMIGYLLANPDFLADKDPYESINQLVLSLGRKHLSRQWPTGADMAKEFLQAELFEDPSLELRRLLAVYEGVDISHFVHLILTVRFAQELGRRAGLSRADMGILLPCAVLHDLNVLDTRFREVLMEPSGRLNRPILTAVLERHAEISAEILQGLVAAGKISLPKNLDAAAAGGILKSHHRTEKGPGESICQILHLADNIAVFADRTRPDHWNRGFLRLEEIAPRWIDAQLERLQIDRNVWDAAQGFFSDPANFALLRRLDRLSAFYPQCYSALQMAAALHLGLNPQHPNPMADLRERYGGEIVDRIFDNLMKSGLSVRDKIKVINRTDSIAPMLLKENVSSFAFINAGAQPVQRVVELILRFVREGRVVILMGILPRVIKTYERFCAQEPAGREQVCVIAGERRLQFVTHTYPYEADFKMPFHKIIRAWRESRQIEPLCCLIPFERFMESYAPTAEAEERVRKLEKASDIEELRETDRVRAEAERYLEWERSGRLSASDQRLRRLKCRSLRLRPGAPSAGISDAGRPMTFDERDKERFRRILLGGFTNRDVLLFYDATVEHDIPVKKALREVIGALHENPNYLSDRSVYYSIQELVRSLGQIHFYPPGINPVTRNLRKFLQDHALGGCANLAGFLDAHKPQFNFFKQHLADSLQIAVSIGRLWEKTRGSPMTAEDWRVVTAGALLSGSILEDGATADVLLSPEDISSNRTLRHLLSDIHLSIWPLVSKRKDFQALLTDTERTRVQNILDESRLDENNRIPFLLIHTALTFGAYCDFSKVENWKRGKVEIMPEDMEFLWKFLFEEFRRLPGVEKELAGFGRMMRKFCGGDGARLLNVHAGKTHSYVRLFNALSLAAELRYGLKARGFDLFHNVRTIYGSDVAELLVDGIMDADFHVREKVKFVRKLRILAAAVTAETVMPERILFIHTDHPLGVLPRRDIRLASGDGARGRGMGTILIPAGDYDRTVRMFLSLAGRVDREIFQKLRRRVKFLVGEDYPLLIKEKSLQKTDEFRARITAYRNRRHILSRHIFVPLGELVDFSGAGVDGELRGGGTTGDKGLFFFQTWTRLFE